MRNKAGNELISAAKRGNAQEVEKVLSGAVGDKSLAIIATDESGNTALHKTAMYNHHAVARVLLNAGAHVDATEFRGMTALMLAMANGFVETAKELMHSNASLSIRSANTGYTALMYAALWGKFACCQLVVNRADGHVHLVAQAKSGETAMSIARKAGFVGVADFLSKATTAAEVAAAAKVVTGESAPTAPPTHPNSSKPPKDATVIKQALAAAREKATEIVMRAVVAAGHPAVHGASTATASTASILAAAPTAETRAAAAPTTNTNGTGGGSLKQKGGSFKQKGDSFKKGGSFRAKGGSSEQDGSFKQGGGSKQGVMASSMAAATATKADAEVTEPPSLTASPPAPSAEVLQVSPVRLESTSERVRRVSKDVVRGISGRLERFSKDLLSA